MAGTLVVSTVSDGTESRSLGDLFKDDTVLAKVAFKSTSNPLVIYKQTNVSSITDNGTGSFTINFITPMPDAYYTLVGSAQRDGKYTDIFVSLLSGSSSAQTTTSAKIGVMDAGGSAQDTLLVSLAILA